MKKTILLLSLLFSLVSLAQEVVKRDTVECGTVKRLMKYGSKTELLLDTNGAGKISTYKFPEGVIDSFIQNIAMTSMTNPNVEFCITIGSKGLIGAEIQSKDLYK